MWVVREVKKTVARFIAENGGCLKGQSGELQFI